MSGSPDFSYSSSSALDSSSMHGVYTARTPRGMAAWAALDRARVNRLYASSTGILRRGMRGMELSVQAWNFCQSALRKFHRRFPAQWTTGMVRPICTKVGLCWLRGKSSRTVQLAGSRLQLVVETQHRSGEKSLCHRVDLKVPRCFGSWMRAKSPSDAHSMSLAPSASSLS